ncbi:DUF5996 family protein [Vulgatibacter sp.]|uniref:DUF5996 family protein n=1 Tax=Vulgatibacter sp. TaxID=1971226 RepID=UPI003565C4A4
MHADWPALPYDSWKDTLATLHRWTQVAGKVQLALTPLVNHFWNAGMRVGVRGLTSGPICVQGVVYELAFDFLRDRFVIRSSEGREESLPLEPRTVADFYEKALQMLASFGIEPAISDKPCEIATEAIPFRQDTLHFAYDPEAARTWWRILRQTVSVFEIFRSRYVGKSSPVLFWWGSFDLAVTRFSGNRAPVRPDAGPITREAHSHEQSSAGIWPGTPELGGPAYFAYTAPAPRGLSVQRIEPEEAWYDHGFGEFLLRYEDVRRADDPVATLLGFLQSSYEAGARLAGWERTLLERQRPAGQDFAGAPPESALHPSP